MRATTYTFRSWAGLAAIVWHFDHDRMGWHAYFNLHWLGIYLSPEAAARAVGTGQCEWPPEGNPQDLGVSADLAQWSQGG